MQLLYYFLGGMFLFNSIPHLVKGITGQTHMTPFKRVSSPILNIIWAFINLLISLVVLGLATNNGTFVWFSNADLSGSNLYAFLGGALIMSLMDGNLFGNPNARLPWQKD